MPARVRISPKAALVEFVDANGDLVAAPDPVRVVFAVDDITIATVVSDPDDPLKGNFGLVAEGTVHLFTDVGGVDLDGKPFAVAPISLVVSTQDSELVIASA